MGTLFHSEKKLRLKICGLVFKDDIDLCADLSVDAVGFIVREEPIYPDFITEGKARELICHVPLKTKSVLLVKFSDIEYIARLIQSTRPDVIQLQKEAEGAEIAKKLKALFPNIEIIKTFHVKNDMTTEDLCQKIDEYIPYIDAVNLDSIDGGSGKSHDWNISAAISRYVKEKGLCFVLAGGVNAENIEKAYRKVNPDMIDVMSGAHLDGRKDKKDPEKIKQMMNVINKINSE